MAKKRKAKTPRKMRGDDMKVIEAALNLAGVPAQDAQGRPIETLGGRVIAALARMSPTLAGNVFDPLDPSKVMAAAKMEDENRDKALHPQSTPAPKVRAPRKAKAKAKTARKAKAVAPAPVEPKVVAPRKVKVKVRVAKPRVVKAKMPRRVKVARRHK